ncbi:nitrilase-related carbon-nitrogen hydrolase [Kineococcus terrestris]|uniref:nitrilase-related carbon-nitrogen hydrolase n=1 Tax=Kineococcus terrestris TaxID=2044856 RepID=UPI0034DB5F82
MELACWQTAGAAGEPGDPAVVEANLAALDAAAAEAAAGGADLLVTPEMVLTGYAVGREAVHRLAALPLAERVAEVARRHRLAVVAGLPELDGGACWNTALAVGADGEVLARHRKAHLFGELDRGVFAPGARLVTTFDLPGPERVRVALLICYDVEFPEAVRAAALAGAHLVAVPTAQMEPFAWVAEELVRVRAWENQLHLAYVDRTGAEGDLVYVGRSSVVDPSGAVLASARDGEALLRATVDPRRVAAAQRANPYLADRRTDLY